MDTYRPIIIRPGRVAAYFTAFTVMMLAAGVAVQAVRFLAGYPSVYGLVAQFDFNEDGNVASFVGALVNLGAALLCAAIAGRKRSERAPFRYHWTALSVLFAVLAVHEMIGFSAVLHRALQGSGLDYEQTMRVSKVVGLGILASFALLFAPFLLHLPRKVQLLTLAAGAVILASDAGLGRFAEVYGLAHGYVNFSFALITTAEEICELAGMLIFNYALVLYFAEEMREIRLRFA